MPVGVVWLVAVVASWVAATALLAALIKATANHATSGDVIGQAAVSATFACVFVAGPAAAAALRVRRRHSQRRAALCGLAWQTLPPLVIVTVAELSLALRLRRRCRTRQHPSGHRLARGRLARPGPPSSV